MNKSNTTSKEYLLAEIDDLADEFSEIDENGLHSERWCGIMDAKQIIMNAPSVSDRPQGEWIWDKDGIDWNIGAWRCSNCHGRNANLPNDETIIPLQWSGSNFCPNCGARMKGADNEMS